MQTPSNPKAFDDFEVTRGNRFARAVAVAVAEAPGDLYNPVIMWGPHGAGKSHLLRAIRETIITAGRLDVRSLSGSEFVNDHASEITRGTALLIDDFNPAQFPAVQATLPRLAEKDVQIVVAMHGDYASMKEIYSWARESLQSLPNLLVVDCWRNEFRQ